MPLEFMFKGMLVGYFQEAEYPRQDGRYHYMPYRGIGHYEMERERRSKGSAECHYDLGAERVSFTVLDCPAYGLLELSGFERYPRNSDG